MDLYTAFMRTADRIEKNPTCCLISETELPKAETSYGCVLGWLAYEMGWKYPHADHVLPHLGLPHFSEFSTRMWDIHIDHERAGQWWYTPETIRDYAREHVPKPPALDPALAKLLKGLDTFFTEKA